MSALLRRFCSLSASPSAEGVYEKRRQAEEAARKRQEREKTPEGHGGDSPPVSKMTSEPVFTLQNADTAVRRD